MSDTAAMTTTTSGVAGVVLAAGGSSRFGSPKQLAPFRGAPLLEWPVKALLQAGLARVLVVLGACADRIEEGADLNGATIVRCSRWHEGQAASLREAALALPDAEAMLVVLGDQPLLAPAAIRRVVDAYSGQPALRASYGGHAGHPTLLARSLWPRVLRLEGDQGARELLAASGFTPVPCDGLGSPADADTPEDLAALARRADPEPA